MTPHTAFRPVIRSTTGATSIRRPFSHFAALAVAAIFVSSIGAMYLATALVDFMT